MTKEFYVDTAALKAVGTDIQNLLDRIQNDDASKGTYTQFGTTNSISEATATFWKDGKNPLADAYQSEWTYLNDTYTALISQLQHVMGACTGSSTGYSQSDNDSKNTVKQSGEFTS